MLAGTSHHTFQELPGQEVTVLVVFEFSYLVIRFLSHMLLCGTAVQIFMLIARNWIHRHPERWEYRSVKVDDGIGVEERRQNSSRVHCQPGSEPDDTVTPAFLCKQLGSRWPRPFLGFVSCLRVVKLRTVSGLQSFRVPFTGSVPSFPFQPHRNEDGCVCQ